MPADANSGDRITLVVTAEDGETASDTVYVGGFTITKVEPTTDAVTGTGEVGYKYIRAYFSSSLATLAPEDIEIRAKDTEQLYSIDSVKLSSDGTYADITLFGSHDEGGTTFLQAQVIYTMEIANGQGSDTFEFELPQIDSNVLVTKVDIANNMITLANGDTVGGDYEVGDVYDGNLGTLVGRTVNVGVNSDNEIEKLSVRKANVVYGVMKFVDKDKSATVTNNDYFEDQVTKTKYSITTAGTTTINASALIGVVTAADLTIDADGDPVNWGDFTFKYSKLVLNSNGTVACAVLDPDAWYDSIKVADVDGTIVDETTKTSVDFDGYTIEKDGEYVTTADLEADDIVFYQSATKFAEVYNDEAEGELSDIDSTSLKIDGTAHKWNAGTSTIVNSKYYNEDDDIYAFLMADSTVEGQKILNNFDPDIDVTAYLDRLGNVAYIEGTNKESAVTTDTWYVTTSAGAGYTQALTSYLKFKVSDGTEETIEIPVSQIKKFNGVKVKEIAGEAGDEDDGSDYKFTLTKADGEDDNPAFGAAIEAQNLIDDGVLVKITRDENNKIIGIAFGGTYVNDATDTYPVIEEIDGADDKAFKPGVSKITSGDTTAKLTDDTVIWVYTVDADGNKKVTKETFADYTRTTKTLDVLATDDLEPWLQFKNSAVTDVLIHEELDDDDVSNVFAKGETTTAEGIVTGYTTKLNSDSDANYVNTVTLLTIDNSKVTYTALDESLATPAKDKYAVLKLDKATGDIQSITENAWTVTNAVVDRNDSTSKTIKTADDKTVELDSTALALKKSGSTYTKITLNQVAASTKPLYVSWHDEYYNDGTGVHYADFLVVSEFDAEVAEGFVDTAVGAMKEAFDALDGTTDAWDAFQEAWESADDAISDYVAAGGDVEDLTLDDYTAAKTAATTGLEAAKDGFAAIPTTAPETYTAAGIAALVAAADGYDNNIVSKVSVPATAADAATTITATFFDGTTATKTFAAATHAAIEADADIMS